MTKDKKLLSNGTKKNVIVEMIYAEDYSIHGSILGGFYIGYYPKFEEKSKKSVKCWGINQSKLARAMSKSFESMAEALEARGK
jgi:hypothetical protein